MIISLCFLTACSGGGGGNTPPTTANVRVNVPASLFNIPAETARLNKLPNKLIVSATPYLILSKSDNCSKTNSKYSFVDDIFIPLIYF